MVNFSLMCSVPNKFRSQAIYLFSAAMVLLYPFISGFSHPQMPARGVCAHRGASHTHPENTLAAFEEAVRLGAHMIELDVRLSRDGEMVVMHDATVERTTNGQGRVADLTLAALKRLDAGGWKNFVFEGEPIPTLAEALDIMPLNIWLNVHLKGGAELGQKAAALIAGRGRLHQAFLACKAAAAAAAALAIEPQIMIANMERGKTAQAYVNDTLAMGADFIQLTERADPILAELTQRLTQGGVHINYFGVTSAQKLQYLYESGVEFPLVDDVEYMLQVARTTGIEPWRPLFTGAL